MHPHDDPGAVGTGFGDREQLDDEPHGASRLDVILRHPAHALAVDGIKGDVRVEGELGKDRGLGCRVEGLDIGGRIGLGVAECLGLREHRRVVSALLIHLGEDEVRRAVDDAEDLAHPITDETLAQRAQQRDRPRNGGLDVEVDTVARRGLVERRAIGGEQRLVGRHHTRPRGHGRQDEAARWLDAPHDLDDDVGTAGREGRRIRRHQGRVDAIARSRGITHGDSGEDQRRADARLKISCVLNQEPGHMGSDGATAEQGDAKGGGHAGQCPRRCGQMPQAPGSRASRSSSVSRRRMTRSTPSRTATTAGRGT